MSIPPPLAVSPPTPPLRPILIFDVGLPLLTILVLGHQGIAPLPTYAAASVFPAISVLKNWLAKRRVDIIGLGVLLGIASGLLLAVFTGDPRFGLMRAAPAFALFGAGCLLSLFTRWPLMFFVARAFATGGDPEANATWNRRLADDGFQSRMRLITVVWGLGTLAHAGLGVASVLLLPAKAAVIVEPAIAVVILAALLAWTNAYQRRVARGA